MPLLRIENIDHNTRLGIWKIEEEDPQFFIDRLQLTEFDKAEIARFSHVHRRLEWCCSRYLIRLMLDEPGPVELRKNGQNGPYFLNLDLHVSISHCKDYAVALISQTPMGVDVEAQRDKIVALGSKFLTEPELQEIQGFDIRPKLTLLWSAKESMYKLHGLGGLEFKRHLKLQTPTHLKSGVLKGQILTSESAANCEVVYRFFDNHVLTFARPLDALAV